MIRDSFWFLSNSVCVFYPWVLGRWQKNNELEKSYTIANHLSSYYHMFYHVYCQTTNSTFSVNIVVVSRTTHFLQDQELETKIKTKRIKLYKQTIHFFFTISDQFMKENLFWYFFNLLQSFDFVSKSNVKANKNIYCDINNLFDKRYQPHTVLNVW